MIGFNTTPIKRCVSALSDLAIENGLLKMFNWLIKNNKTEIVALCDLKEEYSKAADFVQKSEQ